MKVFLWFITQPLWFISQKTKINLTTYKNVQQKIVSVLNNDLTALNE